MNLVPAQNEEGAENWDKMKEEVKSRTGVETNFLAL